MNDERLFSLTEIRGEDHVRLFVALWVVWTFVSFVAIVIAILLAPSRDWIVTLLVCVILLMYPAITLWYLDQARRRVASIERRLRRVFLLAVGALILAWTVANALVDRSRMEWDLENHGSPFDPSWIGDQFARWGWPFDYLQVFDEPLWDVGTWSFDPWALTINVLCLCFGLWWIAVAGFIASALGHPSHSLKAEPTTAANPGE